MSNISSDRLNTPPQTPPLSPKKPGLNTPPPSPKKTGISPKAVRERDVERRSQNREREQSRAKRSLSSDLEKVDNQVGEKRPREDESEVVDIPSAKRAKRVVEQPEVIELVEVPDDSVSIWLPDDVWCLVTWSLGWRNCTAFGVVCKYFNEVYKNAITKDPSWGRHLLSEHRSFALMGEVLESQRILRLLDRTVVQDDSGIRIIKNDTAAIMRGLFCDHDNEKKSLFMFNIISGVQCCERSYDVRSNLLSSVELICREQIAWGDNEYAFYQARKILEYYFNHETTQALRVRSIFILFLGTKFSMWDDSYDINCWIQLLGKAFETLCIVDRDKWFKKCIELLKTSGSTEEETADMDKTKKEILRLLRSKLPEYLKIKRINILPQLIASLRNKKISQILQKKIEDILEDIGSQKEWAQHIVQHVINDHDRVHINKNDQKASYRLISSLIKQHGKEVLVELIDYTNSMILKADEKCKPKFRAIIREVYECNDISEQAFIVGAIRGYMSMYSLSLEHEFSRQLTDIISSYF